MNDQYPTIANDVSDNRHLLWLATLLVGAVFFYVSHSFRVTQYADFAPWSDSGDTLEAGRNTLKGVALASVGLLGAYFIIRRSGRPMRPAGWLPALIAAYLAWAAASTLWSSDPGLSCRRLAVLLFCVLAAVGCARQLNTRDIAVMALAITGAYLIIGIATEIALGTFHPWASSYRFAGTVHPNSQGANLTVFCLSAFCLARFDARRRAWPWILFVVGAAFLLLTKSRTACGALIAVLGALWWIGLPDRAKILATLSAGSLLLGAALVGSLLGIDLDEKATNVVMLGRGEESQTFTGRLPIWSELAGYVEQRPYAGYGYAGFWTDRHIEDVSEAQQWPLREAHNAYIDTVLSIGLIGITLLLAIVLSALWRAAVALRQTGDAGYALTFCLLVFGLLHACLETGMADPNLTTLLGGVGVIQLAFPTLLQTASDSLPDPIDMTYSRGLHQS